MSEYTRSQLDVLRLSESVLSPEVGELETVSETIDKNDRPTVICCPHPAEPTHRAKDLVEGATIVTCVKYLT
jgi:hypothetical protein